MLPILSRAEWDLMDELYFIASWDDLRVSTRMTETNLTEILNSLLTKELVRQLKYDPAANDFTDTPVTDMENLRLYHYTASRKGLEAHNLRQH